MWDEDFWSGWGSEVCVILKVVKAGYVDLFSSQGHCYVGCLLWLHSGEDLKGVTGRIPSFCWDQVRLSCQSLYPE